MIDLLKSTYKELEKTYNEADKYISEIIDDSIETSTNYLSEVGNDISDYLNDLVDDDKTSSIKNNKPDIVLVQLSKLNDSLNSNTDEKIDSKLIFTATSLGHINEKITKLFCTSYKIDLGGKNTQASRINALKNHLSKSIINDLHFINSFRNSILHHNDYGHDLPNLDKFTKNKLLSESKTAIVKMEYIYDKLKNVKLTDK